MVSLITIKEYVMENQYRMKIIEHGLMMPEFFSGTEDVQLSIAVDKNSTVGDVLEGIKQEIIMLSDHIQYTFKEYGLDGDTIEKLLEEEVANLEKECLGLMEIKPYENILDHSFEDYDEDMDTGCFPVVIFTIHLTN